MIAVVDYDAGNLRSVETALRFVGAEFQVTRSPELVKTADRVIFPGVGEASHAIGVLRERGLDQALRDVAAAGRYVLGICLGAQIVLDYSEENDTTCLGLIPGAAKLFPPREGLKVPQIGWNTVEWESDTPLFRGIPSGSSFYFVHSYYPKAESPAYEIASCEYSVRFSAALQRANVVATQFHPEKSGTVGLQLLKNFIDMP